MITQYHCPTCNKRTEVVSEKPFLKTGIQLTLKCGHKELRRKLAADTPTNGSSTIDLESLAKPEYCETHKRMCVKSIESMTGEHLFPYQGVGAKFVLEANGRAGIFDEMGLGKTVQSLTALKLNKEKMLPCVIVCKAIAKFNWMRHTISWVGEMAQVVQTTSDKWHDMFPIHIMSYETLRICTEDRDEEDNVQREDVKKILQRCKTVIIDETHLMKSDVAQRTKAVKRVCQNASYIIGLSGTPFKNQGGELFSILNTLRPDRFNNRERYLYKYWDVYRDGYGYRIGGLKYPEKFKEDTQDFIIRRTMDEVLPDLPKVRRSNVFVELGDEVQKIYDREFKEFSEFYAREQGKMGGFEFSQNVLQYLNRMRHITGMAKVDAGVQFTEEFLDSTDRKIVIFVHHHRVAGLYKTKIDKLLQERGLNECIEIRSLDIKNVEAIVQEFKDNSKIRVCIASTLAAGESINLQFCSDCLLAERQWNPANEEQAGSGRFRRIGQDKPINFNYAIAVGTIDEYFTDLVEQKRAIFENTMDGKTTAWNEQNIIKELAALLAAKGKAKWKL